MPDVESDPGYKSIIVQGTKEAVSQAVAEIAQFCTSNSANVSVKLPIEQKYHQHLIGKNGQGIQKLRKKHPQVNFIFPEEQESGGKENLVVLKGPAADVRQASISLYDALCVIVENEWIKDGHVLNVPLEKFRIIQGPSWSRVKAIRKRHRVFLGFDRVKSQISFSGKQKSIRKAVSEVEAILAKVQSQSIDIPSRFHGLLIGKNGKNIRHLLELDIAVKFPAKKAKKSDTIWVHALSRADLEAGIGFLSKSSTKLDEKHHQVEVSVPAHLMPHIIGKGGARLRQLLDGQPEVRVDQDSRRDADTAVLRLNGPSSKVNIVRNLLHLETQRLIPIHGDGSSKSVSNSESKSGCAIM